MLIPSVVPQADKVAQPQQEEMSLKRLLEVSTVILQQAVDLVDNDLASDEQLTVHSQYMPGSTIGAPTTVDSPRLLTLYRPCVVHQESTYGMPEIISHFSSTLWKHNPLTF